MIFLVASDGPDLSSTISRRFGHAPWHLIVNSASPQIVETVDNAAPGPRHGLGRVSHHHLDGVIAGNIGPGAFADLQAEGIEMFVARGATVAQAVARVAAGQVRALDAPTLKRSLHEGNAGGHEQRGPGRDGH